MDKNKSKRPPPGTGPNEYALGGEGRVGQYNRERVRAVASEIETWAARALTLLDKMDQFGLDEFSLDGQNKIGLAYGEFTEWFGAALKGMERAASEARKHRARSKK